jgi:methylated-DNA-[protein]-cysteine S-methyltransferase
MAVFTHFYKSPFGWIKIISSDSAILSVDFEKKVGDNSKSIPPMLKEAVKQLDEYFKGSRKVFTVKTKASGTPFQMKIWNAMSKIPYGKTATYQEMAAMAGNPKAARAAGGACHRNPLGVIVPCHRVIGSDGSLTGFGGGLDLKEKLLNHEKNHS